MPASHYSTQEIDNLLAQKADAGVVARLQEQLAEVQRQIEAFNLKYRYASLYGPLYNPEMRAGMLPANRELVGLANLFTINPKGGPYNPDGSEWASPATRPDIYSAAVQLKSDNPQCSVFGYVATNYARQDQPKNTLAGLKRQIDAWLPWGVDGIMLDETSADQATWLYYKEIIEYIHSKGLRARVNPGSYVYEQLMQLADVISIVETSADKFPTEAELKRRTYDGKYTAKCNILVHTQPWDEARFKLAMRYADTVFFTELPMPNPYLRPPQSLPLQVALLKAQMQRR